MIIPLRELENHHGNVYETTSAAIRRAFQITVTGDDELDVNEGKVVSTAIRQVLTKKVQFQIED